MSFKRGLLIPTVVGSCLKYVAPARSSCENPVLFLDSLSGLQECLMSQLKYGIVKRVEKVVHSNAALMLSDFIACNKVDHHELYSNDDADHNKRIRGHNFDSNHAHYTLFVVKPNTS